MVQTADRHNVIITCPTCKNEMPLDTMRCEIQDLKPVNEAATGVGAGGEIKIVPVCIRCGADVGRGFGNHYARVSEA